MRKASRDFGNDIDDHFVILMVIVLFFFARIFLKSDKLIFPEPTSTKAAIIFLTM